MKKHAVLFLLICLNQSIAGMTLQKITNDDFPSIFTFDAPSDFNHTVIDDHLYFIAGGKVAVSDGTNLGTYILDITTNQSEQFSSAIRPFNEKVAYIFEKNVWVTDGMTAVKASEYQIDSVSRFIGQKGTLITQIESNATNTAMQIITEEKIEIIDSLGVVNFSSICVVDEANFFFETNMTIDGTFISEIKHYKNGEIIDVFSEDKDGDIYRLIGKYEDACYYVKGGDLLRLDSTGLVMDFVVPKGFNTESMRLLPFKGRLHLLGIGAIYRVFNERLTAELVFDFSSVKDLPGNLFGIRVSENYLYMNWAPFTLPSIDTISVVFDENFNIVSRTDEFISIAQGYTLNITSVGEEDFIVTNRSSEILRGYTGFKQTANYLPLKGLRVRQIIDGGEVIYAMIEQLGARRQTSLYILTDKPKISQSLSGVWTNEDWAYQGLVVSTGQRPNGSEYIFTNLNGFLDGRPFWLAGNADMILGEDSVTIDLSEFSGASFFDGQRQETVKIPYGQMSIEPIGCNEIQVQIQPELGDVIDLSLNRIANTGIANCTE